LNFKTLGKKYGKHMKAIQAFVNDNNHAIIQSIELTSLYEFNVGNEKIVLEAEDVEIIPVDLPGWKVANEGAITVALDITITSKLKEEGIAREIINRIQTIRKEKGLEVTDKIGVKIQENSKINTAITNNLEYICAEILASEFSVVNDMNGSDASLVDIDDEIQTSISISKTN
jgi:isoleucyl-tRNA synthetase